MAFHGGAVVHDHGEHHETEQGGKGTGRGDLKTHADEGHRRDGAQATGDPKSGGGKTPVGKDKQGFLRVGGVVEMNGTRDQEEKTTEKDHDGFVQLEDDGGDIGRKNGGCFDEQWVWAHEEATEGGVKEGLKVEGHRQHFWGAMVDMVNSFALSESFDPVHVMVDMVNRLR